MRLRRCQRTLIELTSARHRLSRQCQTDNYDTYVVRLSFLFTHMPHAKRCATNFNPLKRCFFPWPEPVQPVPGFVCAFQAD